jgi:hypothetical protein
MVILNTEKEEGGSAFRIMSNRLKKRFGARTPT